MYCPSCMRYNSDENAIKCEFCHEPMNIQNNTFQLPVGTILAGRYYVGKVLGQGGFGITYIGCDLKLNIKMAIKEYYPQGLIGRMSKYDLNLTVNSGNQNTVYEIQKDRFMKEAKILAEFSSDTRIVRVTDIFEENNTAYIVMDYVEGITLEHYCRQFGRMTFDAVWDMLHPLADTLGKIHDRGLIHRDISPSNIMINENAGVKLIDFGSARDYSATDDKSLSVVLKPGYAPPEQYSTRGQGPWTDVYALCATIYRTITGVIPVNVFERMANDDLQYPSSLGAVIRPEQEAVLMCGLDVNKAERIQSMYELRDALKTAEKGQVVDHIRAYYKNSNIYLENVSTGQEVKNDNYSANTSNNEIDEYTEQRLETIYKNAVNIMTNAEDIESYEAALLKFKELGDYKNAHEFIIECKNNIGRLNGFTNTKENIDQVQSNIEYNANNIEQQKQEDKYQNAMYIMESAIGIDGYETAINIFKELGNYKDTQKFIEECQRKIASELNRDLQTNRNIEKNKHENEIKIKSTVIILAIIGAFVVIYLTVIIPALQRGTYNTAVALMEDKKYKEAIFAFRELNGYLDSNELIEKCEKEIENSGSDAKNSILIDYGHTTSGESNTDTKNSIIIDYSAADSSSNINSLYEERLNKKGKMYNFDVIGWDLHEGSIGEDVVKLQNALNALGYYDGTVDGEYGSVTSKAVEAFCKKNGVSGERKQFDTATMFIQALLYGDKAIGIHDESWEDSINGVGKFAANSLTLKHNGSNGSGDSQIQYQFINHASLPVEALRIIYWFEDRDGNIVKSNGNPYTCRYFYDMSIKHMSNKMFSWEIDINPEENKDIYMMKAFVAEIGYDSGNVYITYDDDNGVIEPLVTVSQCKINE